MCFFIIPALVGILIILFSISVAFSDEAGIYKSFEWGFFGVFLGLVLIAHTIISIINLCKYEY